MIRWKILKQSIKLIVAIAILWSCSEEKSNSGQDIFLEISERKEFKIFTPNMASWSELKISQRKM